ncbi:MAG TPA: hypothetical protein VFJ72_14140 [Rubrobacteraceae bacterium]|nr:hypothetical protein [Rubrobacteraceae bacterium]
MTDTRKSARRGVWTPIAVLTPIFLLGLVVLFAAGCGQAQRSSSAEEKQASKPSSEQSAKKPEPAARESRTGGRLEHPALGEKGAPVVMVEYADYQ